MKKFFALILAVIMMMACLPAYGSTVDLKITVDKEEMKNLNIAQPNPEAMAPVLDLLNALEIKAITADNGLQIDLGLNGSTILSLAGALNEGNLTIGSNLIPSYLLRISAEQIQTILQQFMRAAAAGTGSESLDMAKIGESVGKYFTECGEAFAKAVKPGETETGSWTIEGITFDVKTAQEVDEMAMAEAVKKLVHDLLADETIKGLLASAPGFDADQVLKTVDEAMTEEHVPEVQVNVYGTSEESPAPVCSVSEATYRGQETPAYTFTRLNKGTGEMKISLNIAEPGVDIVINAGPAGVLMEMTQGEAYVGLRIAPTEGGIKAELLSKPETAAMTLTVTLSAEGTRTLSLEPEGKTVLSLEDLQGGNAEAMTGLQQELLTGLGQLLSNPAVTELMSSFNQRQVTEEVNVDPSAWKTIGDVLDVASGSMSYGTEGEHQQYYVVNFEYGGKYWLAKADLPAEKLEELLALDVMDEDYRAKVRETVGSLEATVVDLSTMALPQEELDQWIGKTGQDMLDAGWEENGYESDGKDLFIHMINGNFQYNVSFGDAVKLPEGDEPIAYAGAKIVSVTFAGPSYHFTVE